ncbi:MAG: hypothetical protein EAZ53_16635 [Bacteroidetes bacterium]|nr:MAG: hypothetical protein EAZ53_16635 [Bacteroidota bacterium]
MILIILRQLIFKKYKIVKSSIKNLAIVASVVAIVYSAKAQSNVEFKKLEKSAFAAFKAQKYSEALVQFTKLDNLAEDKVRYDYMIGMCLMSTENKETALPYFRSAMKHETTSFVVNYYLGRAYMNQENYLEAGHYFQTYKEQLREYMNETGFRFKNISSSTINETNRIHMEKTLEDVNSFISLCADKRAEIYAQSK